MQRIKNFILKYKIAIGACVLMAAFGIGYWVFGNPGTTSIGEDVTIGNDLTVTASSSIGGNLTVSGNISGDIAASNITSGRFGKSRLEWTADKLLKGAGIGSDPTEIDVPSGPLDALAGNILVAYADTERSHSGSTPNKEKEIKINRPGTYRITFDAKESESRAGNWGRIYRNGVAVGGQQDTGTSYVTYTEDIAGWSAGDLCQVYLDTDGVATVYVKNFRIYILSFYDEVILD